MTRPQPHTLYGPRTRTDDKGRVWTLDGDRWLADPDLVVKTSGAGKDRTYYPGRAPGSEYGTLAAAMEVEARLAEEQRERVIEALQRSARHRAAEREDAALRADGDATLSGLDAGVWAAAVFAVFAGLVLCAGFVSVMS